MNLSTATGATNAERVRRLPGEAGIWIFILLDVSIFAEMFGIYVWYRAENRELFETSQQLVNPAYGLGYTMLLLTSSWCIVVAVSAARQALSPLRTSAHRQLVETSSRFVMWGFALGAAFGAIKFVEYGAKLHNGITPVTNEFFMFFFVMTFVHLLHVAVGLGVLIYMRNQVQALQHSLGQGDQNPMRMIETSGVYWHMVDLLWIVLFALFYLRG